MSNIDLCEFGYVEDPEAVREFGRDHGAHFAWRDAKRFGHRVTPKLAMLDEAGNTEKQIEEGGANYLYSRVDYLKEDGAYRKVDAAREIAQIPRGERVELALSTLSELEIDIHQGEGMFMVGRPGENQVKTFMLDSEITPSITLPIRSFYTLKAASWAAGPLIISCFRSSADPEIVVEHDPATVQDTIETDEGPILVPIEFNILYELRSH